MQHIKHLPVPVWCPRIRRKQVRRKVQLVSHSHSASHRHEEILLSLNQAESFFCLLYCMSIFIFSQAVSLLAAVYSQPGRRAGAKTIIIPSTYDWPRSLTHIQRLETALAPILYHEGPTLKRWKTVPVSISCPRDVKDSCRPPPRLGGGTVCPLKLQCFTRFSAYLQSGKKGHTGASNMQHMGVLMADGHVASLAPCALEFS